MRDSRRFTTCSTCDEEKDEGEEEQAGVGDDDLGMDGPGDGPGSGQAEDRGQEDGEADKDQQDGGMEVVGGDETEITVVLKYV